MITTKSVKVNGNGKIKCVNVELNHSPKDEITAMYNFNFTTSTGKRFSITINEGLKTKDIEAIIMHINEVSIYNMENKKIEDMMVKPHDSITEEYRRIVIR